MDERAAPLSLTEVAASGRATLSVQETARLLGISLGSARKAVRNGEIPSLRLGCRWLVPVPKLLAILGAVEDDAQDSVDMAGQS